ncbi:hypothetical protein GTA08_BOTSDO03016 [Botryosphaeria dothidea]|uniref:Uncharacterized protein n=1 Tax=Botryosphaeria dothidea TaxID=55169 RepID=A0A8H4N5R0_9PEZI|nr:hypothetical protein GTA08_BOTSDO03016 [Botryosphaeria dothidea]
MLSTNQCLFAIITLLAVIASGAALEDLDSNNQRHLPQPLAIPPLHENLRFAGKKRSSPLLRLFFPRASTDNDDTTPNDPAGDRISTTDPDVVTPSNGNEETTDPSDGNPDDTNDANNESVYTLSGSYTADTSFTTPIATGTVHTGGIGGGTSTGETATATMTTTTGVLGPNTTGSVPSGGNVVPSETASASAGTSVTATGTGATGTQTGTGASATSVSGSASAGAGASATESSSESGSTFSPSTTSANQTGASQSQGAAAENAVNVGGLLGLVGVGIGLLL